MSHWLLHYKQEFEEQFERWLFAHDHMRSNVYGQEESEDLSVIDSLVPDDFRIELQAEHKRLKNIDRTYLIQKDQGELDEAYDERKEISAYTPYYPFAVASLAGMFFDAQDSLTPTWQPEDVSEGLGDPEDEDTVAHRLENNIDGKGNSFATHLWGTVVNMITMGQTWAVTEGVERNAEGEKVGEAAVRSYAPLQVENWLEKSDRFVEVKLRITVDTRESLEDLDGEERAVRHVVYDTQGWREFSLQKHNESTITGVVENEDSYAYYATSDQRKRILPIFRTKLPLRGNPGYNAARMANTIFNLESSLDFELWHSSFNKFKTPSAVDDDGINEQLTDAVKESLKKGHSYVVDGEYFSPSAENGEFKQKRIEKKVRQFFRTFFQQFGDATKERTATEMRQEARAGVGAFLTTLAHGLENYVNSMLWRLEQVYFPERPELWGQASWTAQKDFDPIDLEDKVEQMVRQFFPAGKVPLTETAAKAIIAKAHDIHDLPPPEEDELDSAVEDLITRRAQARSAARDFQLEG